MFCNMWQVSLLEEMQRIQNKRDKKALWQRVTVIEDLRRSFVGVLK